MTGAQSPGFDRQQFLNLGNARSEAFAKEKRDGRGWMPPEGEYTCELIGVRMNTFVKEGETIPFIAPQFKIAEAGELMDRTFDQMFTASDKGLGVLSRTLSALYSNSDQEMSEQLGEAMLNCDTLKGHYYVVAVKPGSNPQYKNVYINKNLGKQQA